MRKWDINSLVVCSMYLHVTKFGKQVKIFKLEPDGTEVELVSGFGIIVLRKAKMQLFHI